MVLRVLLKRISGADERLFREGCGEKLQPNRQPTLNQPARDRDAGQPGVTRRCRHDIGEIHLERFGGSFADFERRCRRSRCRNDINLLEGGIEVGFDECPHFLRLFVVGILIARAEREGAEHNAAFHLLSEPFAARLFIQREELFRGFGSVSVSHTVVSRQIRARLRWRDDVIGGDGVFGMRKGYLHHTGTEVF